jgi:hypothetical protein
MHLHPTSSPIYGSASCFGCLLVSSLFVYSSLTVVYISALLSGVEILCTCYPLYRARLARDTCIQWQDLLYRNDPRNLINCTKKKTSYLFQWVARKKKISNKNGFSNVGYSIKIAWTIVNFIQPGSSCHIV